MKQGLRMRIMNVMSGSVLGIIILKTVIGMLFSSDYQDKLFIPFIMHFLQNFDNPWQHFFNLGIVKAFPYPPLMLYIYSLALLPLSFIVQNPGVIQGLFFKVPILLADIMIFCILVEMFPTKKKEIFWFYFTSPIVLYSSYMHSQLDLVPTAVLLLSIYWIINNKNLSACLALCLAISIKFHVIAVLPLMILYLIKNKKFRAALYFLTFPIIIYVFFAMPYLFSQGYYYLVLNNKEQQMLFDIYFIFKDVKIYLALLALVGIYSRFSMYPKVNNDLFFSFSGILFAVFVMFIPPMPAWYIWLIPYLTVFFISTFARNRNVIYGYISFSVFYLNYFLFFHKANNLSNLKFLGVSLEKYLLFNNPLYKNISFTLLEAMMIYCLYGLYKYGIKSNSVYKLSEKPFMIGIGGDSGTGKSTLLDSIKKLLGCKNVLVLEGDGYHKWERNNKNWHVFTHLNPKANFLHKQSDTLFALKNGKTVEQVEYDHNTGNFSEPVRVDPKDYIVMCGLHPYYLPKLRKNMDLKIYVDTDEKLRRHWKILRDTVDRGYTPQKVEEQIEERTTDAKRYVKPQKEFADIIINYYPHNNFKPGDPDAKIEFGCKLAFDSNLELDELLEELYRSGVDFTHDYSKDLETQYLDIKEVEINLDYEEIIDKIIKNKDEILKANIIWETGLRGFIQLIVLLMITEKMKGD